MHIPFGIPIPFLEIYPRCECISSRKFIAALLEIMRKLDIAMYTIEGRLNKQINNNTWNACLFCVSAILRAPTYVKSCDLTRTLTLGSLRMMSQPREHYPAIQKPRGGSAALTQGLLMK